MKRRRKEGEKKEKDKIEGGSLENKEKGRRKEGDCQKKEKRRSAGHPEFFQRVRCTVSEEIHGWLHGDPSCIPQGVCDVTGRTYEHICI